MKNAKLLPLSHDHLDLVLTWRNRDDVRKNMYNNTIISEKEHRSWFDKIIDDNTKQYFVYELDGKLCGVIGFVDINTKSESASWAFYSGDSALRGIGSLMEIAALGYAFDVLNLKKLYCEVLEFNDAVIKFHKKHGFQNEGVFKKHHYAEGQYWDIHRLAIFKDDWTKCRNDISNKKRNHFSPGKVFKQKLTVTEKHIWENTTAINGDNKLHCDKVLSQEVNLKEKRIRGLLTPSIFSTFFSSIFPNQNIVYVKQFIYFQNPVYVDTELEVISRIITKIGQKVIIKISIITTSSNTDVIKGEVELLLSENKTQQAPND
jgi:UDP-4-amino-4,6-dideoxy-N-acetyl-beta-L-altrosamine N-acetyltransferase